MLSGTVLSCGCTSSSGDDGGSATTRGTAPGISMSYCTGTSGSGALSAAERRMPSRMRPRLSSFLATAAFSLSSPCGSFSRSRSRSLSFSFSRSRSLSTSQCFSRSRSFSSAWARSIFFLACHSLNDTLASWGGWGAAGGSGEGSRARGVSGGASESGRLSAGGAAGDSDRAAPRVEHGGSPTGESVSRGDGTMSSKGVDTARSSARTGGGTSGVVSASDSGAGLELAGDGRYSSSPSDISVSTSGSRGSCVSSTCGAGGDCTSDDDSARVCTTGSSKCTRGDACTSSSLCAELSSSTDTEALATASAVGSISTAAGSDTASPVAVASLRLSVFLPHFTLAESPCSSTSTFVPATTENQEGRGAALGCGDMST
ncbi:hypothetical protein K438DRAFT_908707 [Mycena galopus ATCC 62051]|nr:hypothetical protein K438DRAFT_908707 [Mycena galopus ATCC 62051]